MISTLKELMNKSILALLVASAMASQASASVVFADRTSWSAAVAVTNTVGYEGIARDDWFVELPDNHLTIEGVTVKGQIGSLFVIGKDYAESGGTFCLGTGACLFTYGPSLDASVQVATNAFAFDLRGYFEGSTDFTVEFADGESFSVTAANPGGAFFGVALDNAVSSFKIRTNSEFMEIDNVAYGAAATVPEPTGLALVSLALAGLALSSRRRSAV